MKLLKPLIITAYLIITGCAPTVWVKPGAVGDVSRQEMIDRMACQNYAINGVMPEPELPVYGGTNVSGFIHGNDGRNYKYSGSVTQNSHERSFNIGSNIGAAIGNALKKRTLLNDCMENLGWIAK